MTLLANNHDHFWKRLKNLCYICANKNRARVTFIANGILLFPDTFFKSIELAFLSLF